jgi:hypothetical protein
MERVPAVFEHQFFGELPRLCLALGALDLLPRRPRLFLLELPVASERVVEYVEGVVGQVELIKLDKREKTKQELYDVIMIFHYLNDMLGTISRYPERGITNCNLGLCC